MNGAGQEQWGTYGRSRAIRFPTGGLLIVAAIFLASFSVAPAGSSTLPSLPASPETSSLGPFTQAYIIPVEDEISDITFDSIERRLGRVQDEQIPLVILELDTPGGALGATLEICKMLKEFRDDGVAVYAWINKDAYSAGTIIALATDGIVMARNATIGDCQPIMLTGGGAAAIPEEIEAKATSPLLAELRDSARRDGYPLDMVFALIRPEMELFWVVNTDTGERRFVDGGTRDKLFGLDEDTSEDDNDDDEKKDRRKRSVSKATSDSESTTAWRYIHEVPGLDKVHQPIVSDRELLTMRTPEASAYGFSVATLNDVDDLKNYFNVTGQITKLETTHMEKIVGWLASPTVRGVLFLLMLLGAYAEFQTPGLGVPGAVALVALVLFLGAPYVAGYTVTWEILAIVIGLVLLGVEVFVIPGFGVAGIAGIVLIGVGLIASFMPTEPGQLPDDWFRLPQLPGSYLYLRNGLLSIVGGLIGSLVGMVLLARYLPRMSVASRLITPNPRHDDLQIDDPYQGVARLGDVGVVEGLLRPAGKARFGQILVDVVSEGEFIDSGCHVKVVQRHGNRVVVRCVEEAG